MTRLDVVFDKVYQQQRSALVCFLTAGYPDIDLSTELLCSLPQHGADIVELGIPFSDASADGETVRQASYQALQNGIDMEKIFTMAQQFRQRNPEVPLVLMGYYNPIFFYGVRAFVKQVADIGVDGMIIVDLPPEEEREVTQYLDDTELALIHLITPTTGQSRLERITQSARGFLYYVSVTGVTGTQTPQLEQVEQHLKTLTTSLPIAIGFGIKQPQQAKEFGNLAQAVVVGSSLIRTIQEAKDTDTIKSHLEKQVKDYAKALSDGNH